MSDLQTRAEAVLQDWLSSTEALAQRAATVPRPPDAPGPLVLVLNLAHVNVESTLQELHGASDEVIKAHRGVRTTFAVLKVLSPGFASVTAEGDAPAPKKGGGGGKRGGGAAEVKEKLSILDGEALRMHSYDLVNKKGVYTRSGRSGTFATVAPGLVLSITVWGSKAVAAFKGQATDIPPFALAVVQLGFKSINSSAATSGHMLEVKGIQAMPGLSPSSLRLLRHDLFPRSCAESSALRDAQTAPPPAAEGASDQSLIRSNIAASVHLVALQPRQNHGVFAVGPDGRIHFHISEPIADVAASAVQVLGLARAR